MFIAVATPDGCITHEYAFDGDPPQITALATRQALRDLAAAVTDPAVPNGQVSPA